MNRFRRWCLGCALLVGLGVWGPERVTADDTPAPVFVVKPYLQLGDAAPGSLRLLWQTDDREGDWTVEYRLGTDPTWKAAAKPVMQQLTVPGLPPYRRYRTTFENLPPAGRRFRTGC